MSTAPLTIEPAVASAEPRGASRNLTGTEEKRSFVQRLFTRIAPRYDWFNRLASLGLDQRWRRDVVSHAEIAPGMRVLDVCAGTGDLAMLCAQRQGGIGEIIGIDLNGAMLSYARRKQASRQLAIQWLEADAQALPFPEGHFDRVVIGFSTRNLSDLTAGLREMVRVLKPCGRLLILETGCPANPLLRAGYQLFLFTIAPVIGFVLTGRMWPFLYLARSVRHFLTPQAVVEHLQAAGTEATYIPLSGGLASLYVATKPGRP